MFSEVLNVRKQPQIITFFNILVKVVFFMFNGDEFLKEKKEGLHGGKNE